MEETKKCPRCKGVGRGYYRQYLTHDDFQIGAIRCGKCKGTGRIPAEPVAQKTTVD